VAFHASRNKSDSSARSGLFARSAAALGFLALASAPLHLSAADKISTENSFTVTLENDIVANSDGDYTGGTELSWAFAAATSFDDLETLPKWCVNLAHLTPMGKKDYDVVGSNISIGQKIFTPQDTRTKELVPDDRPYAGWSYLNFALHGRKDDMLESLGLSLGVVGPDSFAEDVQRAVHDLVDDRQQQGWDNQLGNEIGFIVSYHQDRRIWKSETVYDYKAELVQTRGISLGTIETDVSLGGRWRLGRQLPSDFRAGRIRDGDIGFTPGDPPPVNPSRKRFYIEAAATGFFVARNIFLDGNTFSDSHSVDKRNWVAEFSYGAGFEYKRCRVSFLYNYRTKEFDLQDGGAGFASLAFSFH